MTVFGVRVSCPDRPGSLGAVATALGEAGVNIVTLDVVERGEGLAVDQLVVETSALGLDGVVGVVESVPEVIVELVHTVPQNLRQTAALELAAGLHEADDAFDALAAGVAGVFNASWGVVVRQRTPQPEVVATSLGAPSLIGASTPWLPLSAARSIGMGPWVPSRWPLDPVSAAFAVAPLREEREAVLVARTRGPVFRAGEVDALGHLARIAAQVSEARHERASS